MTSSHVSQAETSTRTFLEQAKQDGGPYTGLLMTDAKVLARVTDGIYRQPASALRELISNAWDADATEVIIQTDRPRFAEIIIRDNGIGMDAATLAHVLHHIGGSAKRNKRGQELGLTRADEKNVSPKGRRLIGKIGIGLFAVSQITRSFQVVTKRAGEANWNVARVVMHRHSDSSMAEDEQYEAGTFEVWSETAENESEHGTTIYLDAIWPQTRETLQDREVWRRYEAASSEKGNRVVPEIPHFHIGAVEDENKDLLVSSRRNLPWKENSSPSDRMHQFLSAIENRFYDGSVSNPSVERECDYYLRAMWELATWCPLPYVDGNPVTTADDNTLLYQLLEDRVEEISPSDLALDSFSEGLDVENFRVLLDGVELKRPVPTRDLPTTSEAIGRSMLFVGSASTTFNEAEVTASGGPLKFKAYFRWSPKVIPVENRGVIIRIGDASGMGYDPTFLGFPVAEQRRLSQITCEVFVEEGLDESLNIDRESFNFSHPHVVFLSRWIHRALRQIIAKQKLVSSEARKKRAAAANLESNAALYEALLEISTEVSKNNEIAAVSTIVGQSAEKTPADYHLDESIVRERARSDRWSDSGTAADQARAIVQVLDIYNLIGGLSASELSSLVGDLQRVITLVGERRG